MYPLEYGMVIVIEMDSFKLKWASGQGPSLKSLNHTIVTDGPHVDDHCKYMIIPQMKIAISNSKILAEITLKKERNWNKRPS